MIYIGLGTGIKAITSHIEGAYFTTDADYRILKPPQRMKIIKIEINSQTEGKTRAAKTSRIRKLLRRTRSPAYPSIQVRNAQGGGGDGLEAFFSTGDKYASAVGGITATTEIVIRTGSDTDGLSALDICIYYI